LPSRLAGEAPHEPDVREALGEGGAHHVPGAHRDVEADLVEQLDRPHRHPAARVARSSTAGGAPSSTSRSA
jgi:hypothetical protein